MYISIQYPNKIFADLAAIFDNFSAVSDNYDFNQPNVPAKVVKNENNVTILIKAPGFKKDDISISIQNGAVIIKGKRDSKEKWLEEEFEKSFKLPEKIKENKISAKLENGILTVTLPYAEESKPIAVEIK